MIIPPAHLVLAMAISLIEFHLAKAFTRLDKARKQKDSKAEKQHTQNNTKEGGNKITPVLQLTP